MAIFNEATYLEHHHYFDTNNRYGYKSKVLRKQAQQTLERISFTKNNAHKLVSTADWLTSQHIGTNEQEWFKSLTPSHLYELSRMSHEGFNFVKEHVFYPDFTFSAGQQDISVRQLEQIRKSYPKNERPFNEASSIPESVKANTKALPPIRTTQVIEFCGADITERRQLELAAESGEVSNAGLVEQFTILAREIDWSSIEGDPEARRLLTYIGETLCFITELANNSRYSPVI